MSKNQNRSRTCAICGNTFANHDVIAGVLVSEPVVQAILQDRPDWSAENYICRTDLGRYQIGRSNRVVWRQLGISHLFRCVHCSLDRNEFSHSIIAPRRSISLHTLEPAAILPRCDPGANHHDEPESPGGERSTSLTARLPSESQSRAGDTAS